MATSHSSTTGSSAGACNERRRRSAVIDILAEELHLTAEPPPEHLRLQRLIDYPREDIGVEYKNWLDLREESARATFAKAAIAMANHGGGYVILGFEEQPKGPISTSRPQCIPEITQDSINQAIQKYAEPAFQCEMYSVSHSQTVVEHPVIRIHGSDAPVLCRRLQADAGIEQHAIYIRKPGPRSEEPRTAAEWRELLDRCVRARRQDMLDAIRSIVAGQVEPEYEEQEPLEALKDYCLAARQRLNDLVAGEPADSPARFPYGYYDMGFALVGASPAASHTEILDRIRTAGRVQLSGWPPFLELYDSELKPYPHEDSVEASFAKLPEGSRIDDSVLRDYWRASLDGNLYICRAYIEDSTKYGPVAEPSRSPGQIFCGDWQIANVAEGILFASRYAREFESVGRLAVRLQFTGLNRRAFVPSYRVRYFLSLAHGGHDRICRTDVVELVDQLNLREIQDSLPEVVHRLLAALFAYFGFYELSPSLVRDTLQQRSMG